jgi:hypothetical protein
MLPVLLEKRVTEPNSQRPAQYQEQFAPVTHVTCVTRGNNDAGEIRTEIDHIARLNAERREVDRQAGRGYDFDSTAPSHIGFMMASNPAYSIIADCRRHGVALRIDRDGALVVGKAGAKAEEPTQPWPGLLVAIEANLETVAELVAAGWTLEAEFPQTEIA